MKNVIKKMLCLFVVVMCISIFSGNNTYATSSSLELSGDGIEKHQNLNNEYFYFCMKPLSIGDKMNIKAEIFNTNDKNKEDVTSKAEWKSSDENVAKVENGIIEAIGSGTTEITVTYMDTKEDFSVYVVSEEEKKGWEFNVNKNEIKMKVDESDVIEIGATRLGMWIMVELLPTIDYWDVDWKIDDETIAKCIPEKGIETDSGNGLAGKATIKALKEGTTKLTAKIEIPGYGIEIIEVPITVEAKDEKKDDKEIGIGAKIIIVSDNNKKILEVGETLKLSVQFLEMSKQNVIWESTDTSIATVDSTGKVTTLKEGKVKIKVHTEDKQFSDEYEITVKKTTSSGKLPQTGDSSQLVVGIAVIVFSVMVVICFINYKKG